jgi:riboflavin synthase
VQGHVDGRGQDLGGRPRSRRWGDPHRPDPDELDALVVQKGSIAIDGVSLTVAALEGPEIRIALIPHTLAATTLGAAAVGDPVNIEVDMIGPLRRHI